MTTPDLDHVRKLLIEANAELLSAADLAALVDQHATAAKQKLAEARLELHELAALAEQISQLGTDGEQQK